MSDYEALPHFITLRESNVKQGTFGLFATRDIIPNTIIGDTHHVIDHRGFEGQHETEIIRTPLGGFCQMYEQHNCTHKLDNGVGKLVTLRKILDGEELTSDFG